MAVAKKPAEKRAKSASVLKPAPKKKVSTPIDDVPSSSSNADASKFAVGGRVTHPMFGRGTVTAINADKLTIEFADHVREIVDYYVKKAN
jgi:hypothetical protein